MFQRVVTSRLFSVGLLALGGVALAAANAVSTKPAPAYISRLEAEHGRDDAVEHHRHDDDAAATPTGPTSTTGPTTTVDDHGGNRGPGTDDTVVDDHGGTSGPSSDDTVVD